MDIDECSYLEKKMEYTDPQDEVNVDKDVAVTYKPDEDKVRKGRSKHKIDEKADDLDHRSKRSKIRYESPDYRTKRSSPRRHHLSPRDGVRSGNIDGDKSIQECRDKINKRRDREERNGRDRNRERNRNKEKIRERDQDKPRESYHDRDHEREKDRDQERPYRSRSKWERYGEERDREKSKDRDHKERESEKDYKERADDIRPHVERKEEIVEEFDPQQDQSRPHKDTKEEIVEEFEPKRDQSFPHKDRKEEVIIEVDPGRDQRTVFAYQPGPPIFGIMPEVPPVIVPSYDLIGVPSECLLLKNMFDPNIEMEPDFELDIKEDVKEECSRFGALRHIHVDKISAGVVYLRFEITEAAMSAQRALHGRWFAGKMITATFMVLQNYEAKFPDSR